MKFKGDILITDPCYIIRDGNDGFKEGITKDDWKHSEYGENLSNLGITDYLTENSGGDGSWEVLKANDPKEALVKYGTMWSLLNGIDSHSWPERYEAAERDLDNYLDSFECMGKFCADSGTTSIMNLDQVRKYNPDIDEWIKKHDHCATIIHDFDGEITTEEIDHGIHIIGEGNINFFTA